MSMFPPDHALRISLADEVHARPPDAVRAPARAKLRLQQTVEGQSAAASERLHAERH